MPNSMTGFGRAEVCAGPLCVTVEARTVNNRYLSVKLRLPPRLMRFEARLEEEVRRVVARGTAEVFVRLRGAPPGEAPSVDAALAAGYVAALRKLAEATGLPADLRLETLAIFPGVVTLEESDQVGEPEMAAMSAALKGALRDLGKGRREEGERLARELLLLLENAEKAVRAIARRAPAIPGQHRRKLHQRISGLLAGTQVALDPGWLEREIALLADRSDIAEELARLGSHFSGFRAALGRKGPVGRTLDFLVQEMGREANTIGAKNQDAAIGRRVIELKTWIERLREQVQNLE
ncbi:MAG: YicC family protein [Planctomycetes bacterium]|nr:YicC family protein [Planctomycetota bacterium]